MLILGAIFVLIRAVFVLISYCVKLLIINKLVYESTKVRFFSDFYIGLLKIGYNKKRIYYISDCVLCRYLFSFTFPSTVLFSWNRYGEAGKGGKKYWKTSTNRTVLNSY